MPPAFPLALISALLSNDSHGSMINSHGRFGGAGGGGKGVRGWFGALGVLSVSAVFPFFSCSQPHLLLFAVETARTW